MFYNILFMFVFCFVFLFYNFCILFLYCFSFCAVSFLFLDKRTDHCHQVEPQLQ